MSRSIAQMMTVGAIAVAVAFGVSEAQAGWGSHGASYGSYGSTGSYGSHGYVGHGSYGSHGGLFARWHAHRAYRHYHMGWHGSYGSYGGWRGSYGGASYGSYGGSYGSHGGYKVVSDSCGSSGGVVAYSAPMQKGYSAPMQKGYSSPVQKGATQKGSGPAEGSDSLTPAVPPPPAGDSASRAGQATLTVSVPADAKVYVNGVLTKSTGSQRRYVSRGLEPDHAYTYEVRAELNRDGQVVQESQVVQLHSGSTQHLAFGLQPAETTLTIHVPEDARVTLAGNEVAGEGPVRVFTTSKLPTGETWSNYTVAVTVERDGQTLQQEKAVDLRAGSSQTVRFEFDSPRVASVR